MEEMAEVAARQRAASLPPATIIPVFHQPEDRDDGTASMVKSERSRRRGSLLVSRFGRVRRNWSLY